MTRPPNDYWQDRAVRAEAALWSLCGILYEHFPAMREALKEHQQEWNRVLAEVERDYQQETPPTTEPTK